MLKSRYSVFKYNYMHVFQAIVQSFWYKLSLVRSPKLQSDCLISVSLDDREGYCPHQAACRRQNHVIE